MPYLSKCNSSTTGIKTLLGGDAIVAVTESTIKIALVDVESRHLTLLKQVLADKSGLEIVGAFEDRTTALQIIPTLKPEAVLIHIESSIGVDTIKLAIRLRRALPNLGIVLISDHRIASAISFLPKEEMPGWSFVLKDTLRDSAFLKRVMQASAQGMVVLDPELVLPAEEVPSSGFLHLTPKQLQTLQLIAEGLTNRAIAEKLEVSVKAVENHINGIYQQLGIDRTDRSIHPRIRAVSMYFTQHLWNPNGNSLNSFFTASSTS